MNYGNQYQAGGGFSMFPPAVKHLLIINGLVYVALITPSVIRDFLFYFGALWPIGSGYFYPWQLVTYMFLHSTNSLWHIIFNMFALWMFAPSIESLWGTKRFVIFYFITGIGAGILQLLLGGGGGPVIGASGAVYGILLAFGMMFPNRQILLLIPPIPIKAKYFVMIFGGLALFSGVFSLQSGIAHFAHLGGMVFGFLLIRYWGLKGGYD